MMIITTFQAVTNLLGREQEHVCFGATQESCRATAIHLRKGLPYASRVHIRMVQIDEDGNIIGFITREPRILDTGEGEKIPVEVIHIQRL